MEVEQVRLQVTKAIRTVPDVNSVQAHLRVAEVQKSSRSLLFDKSGRSREESTSTSVLTIYTVHT